MARRAQAKTTRFPKKPAAPVKTPDLTEAEMLEILKDIARNGANGAARIAAIKVLREMAAGEKPASAGFEALDELSPRRILRTKAV
jgi:hypothetical protein